MVNANDFSSPESFASAVQNAPTGNDTSPPQPRELFEGTSSDDEVSSRVQMPAYMVNTQYVDAQNFNMDDALEAEGEQGDTDSLTDMDSDSEGSEDEELEQRNQLMLIKREHVSEENLFLFQKGIDPEIRYCEAPEDWEPARRKEEQGEPDFESVDNPGKWSAYTYRPVFKKKNKKEKAEYSHHELPTAAVPVPKDDNGKRVINGWEFFYDGWEADLGATHRDGATPENPFPECRKGHLDYDLLKKLGLNKQQIMAGDCLFFYQLLLPFHETHKRIIDKEKNLVDPRHPYYSLVEQYSRKYAGDQGLGGSFGHSFKTPLVKEFVRFDCAITKDGACGGTRGAIHLRWKPGQDNFIEGIANSLSHTRYLQLKRVMKLNDNDKSQRRVSQDTTLAASTL
jgi:hypothetical protein